VDALFNDSLKTLVGSNGIKEKSLPAQFYLYQNYPNPFNPETTITFSINRLATVELTIYIIQASKFGNLLIANNSLASIP